MVTTLVTPSDSVNRGCLDVQSSERRPRVRFTASHRQMRHQGWQCSTACGMILFMAARKTKSPVRGTQEGGEIRLRGKRIPGLDKELTMVRMGSPRKGRVETRRSDEADVMVRKVGKALSRPGISKVAIFCDSH
jgi:hypothetical protein